MSSGPKQRATPSRVSIYVDGLAHKNPIPAAARMGPFLFSSLVGGAEGASGSLPPTLEAQCACMFDNVRRIMEAAGGSLDDVVKVTLWMRDPDQRPVVNAVWLKVFPDPASRPARRTEAGWAKGEVLIECEFVAVIQPAPG